MSGQNAYPCDACRIFMLVGSFFTFIVGCSIILGAVCLFDTFAYEMGLQVAPSQGLIVEMITSILAYTSVGSVLILYSLIVVLNLSNWCNSSTGGDSQ